MTSAGTALREKWGPATLSSGFVGVPTTLLEYQDVLELDCIDLALLIHLARFWWEATRAPYPSKARLARMTGLTARSVQRRLADLERRGFIRREEQHSDAGRQLTTAYWLDGLRARIEAIVAQRMLEAHEQREAPM